jgi:hypothetical protein
MEDTDNMLYVPEEHRVNATQLWMEMDMLEFEFICLKMQLQDEARSRNYHGYREVQRKLLPTTEEQFPEGMPTPDQPGRRIGLGLHPRRLCRTGDSAPRAWSQSVRPHPRPEHELMSVEEYFRSNPMAADFFEVMVGERLGSGSAREVYLSALNHDQVIKFEQASRSFQNVREWEAWNHLRWGPLKKWLAPCVHISACGSVLIQTRTAPLRRSDLKKRHMIPACLGDLKPSNWGIFEGRLVCHDYGTINPQFEAGKHKLLRWNL